MDLELQLQKARTSDNAEAAQIIRAIDLSELNSEDSVLFCKLIEESNKGLLNEFCFKISDCTNSNIAEALISYISSSSISVRNLSGEMLIQIGVHAVEPLLSHLVTDDKHDKKFIIDVLGLIGDNSAADRIRDLMVKESDENVVLACIEALGNLKSSESVKELMNLYSVNELYVPSIVEALGKIASEEAIDLLISVYPEADNLVKYAILESLGEIGNEKTFYFLTAELKKVDGPLAWVTIDSIYKLHGNLNLQMPFDEHLKNKVVSALYDADSNYKIPALSLVSSYDDKEIIEASITAFGDDEELNELIKDKFFNNLKVSILFVEKYIQNNPENIDAILRIIEELFEYPEFVISDYLTGIEIQSFINTLLGIIEDPNEEVRKSAMNLMFKIDESAALLFVDKMLEDTNLWNKLWLLDKLEEMELSEEVIEILKGLINSSDEMVSTKLTEIIQNHENLFSIN